jgi:hypothetical protein
MDSSEKIDIRLRLIDIRLRLIASYESSPMLGVDATF